jgi:hypothetical protein
MSRIRTFKLQTKKGFILAFSFILMLGIPLLLILPGMSNNASSNNPNVNMQNHAVLKKFSSYEELKKLLK